MTLPGSLAQQILPCSLSHVPALTPWSGLCCGSGLGSLPAPFSLLLSNQEKYRGGEKEIRSLIVELSVNDA